MSDDHDHNWHFTDEKSDGRNGDWYTAWACPCGAYKIVELDVIRDDSVTYDPTET